MGRQEHSKPTFFMDGLNTQQFTHSSVYAVLIYREAISIFGKSADIVSM